ncbi:MAG: STAS domain-containing protein [Pseudonocardiaceae bacterium]
MARSTCSRHPSFSLLWPIRRTPPRLLVIDLRAVTFLGASGLAALLDIGDAAARTATSMRLVCDTPVVTRPLEILGLREVFVMFAGLHAALAGVRRHPGSVLRCARARSRLAEEPVRSRR